MNKLNWRNTRYGWQSIKNHDMKKKRKKRKNEVAATKRPQVIDWLQTTDDRPVKFDGNYLSIDRFITHRNQIAYTQIVASRCKRLIILLLLLSTNHGDWQMGEIKIINDSHLANKICRKKRKIQPQQQQQHQSQRLWATIIHIIIMDCSNGLHALPFSRRYCWTGTRAHAVAIQQCVSL